MEKYKITVSEPWDFENPEGGNIIMGEIIKVLSPLSILFKSDQLVNFCGLSGQILLLKVRYEGQTLIQGNEFEGTIGGGLLLIDGYEGKDEKYLEENSKYVLIGRLTRA